VWDQICNVEQHLEVACSVLMGTIQSEVHLLFLEIEAQTPVHKAQRYIHALMFMEYRAHVGVIPSLQCRTF
jgi:hypothetical protein